LLLFQKSDVIFIYFNYSKSTFPDLIFYQVH